MIDRKALWFSIAVIIATIAAALWRISLLPDWHRMALDGPGSAHTLNSLFLFAHPLGLTVATLAFYGRKWFVSGSAEDIQPWRRNGTQFVTGFSVIAGLMQAFMISRSFGYGLAVDRADVARIAFAAMGVLLIVVGNVMPKLPWLTGRFRAVRLDPWQQKRHLRFTGLLMVGMGLYFVVMAAALPWLQLLPQAVKLPVFLAPGPLVVAATLWHRARLTHAPSPLP